ncbi:MAG TPA: MarC family protein [Desulfomicrobiaceae bacterium]|nr:MarC family protein [Desulfomicrobiaceae bacterium]
MTIPDYGPAVLLQMFEIAFPLFLIMDPIANSATCLAILKEFSPVRQRRIIFRELAIALGIIIMFHFLGEGLLTLLGIQQSTLRVAGGVILFIISMRLVFPAPEENVVPGGDPFFVPIATPFIAGPSLLAAVMVYSRREEGGMVVLGAILIAWLGSLGVMLAAPSLQRVLGKRGIRAAERLMGLILILLSVQMLEDGVRMFLGEL